MKKTCSQIKDAARPCLFGQYGTLIASILVIELITILVSIPFTRMVNIGIQYMAVSQIILGYVGVLIVAMVSNLFGSGILYMHLRLARGEKIGFSHILYCLKNHPDRYMGFSLIITLAATLLMLPGETCSALAVYHMQQNGNPTVALQLAILGAALCIVGVIVELIIILSLSQTVLLMLDQPNLTLGAAMRQSRQLMRRNKWRLFVLYLSFIGWLLLGLVSLGLGLLWILHYIEQSAVQFYLDLKSV